MGAIKRKGLEAAGWRIGDAADFLGMGAEERQLFDARAELALAIRRQRAATKLSQQKQGARIKTSQPRVAKIERAASDVSLDQLVRAFTAAGGKLFVRFGTKKPTKAKQAKSKRGTLSFEMVTSKPGN